MAVDNTIQKILNGLEVLLMADGLKNIPDINIKENTDMRRLISEVINIDVNVDPNNEDLIPAVFKALNEKFSVTDNAALNEINNISMKFASELENCFSVLKDDIAIKVKQLQDDIKERYIRYIKREGADSLLTENEDINVKEDDYIIIKWKNIATPAEMNTVIAEACSNVNLSNHDINSFNASVIREKLLFKVESLDCPAETVQEVEQSLQEYFKDGDDITDMSISLFIKMLTDVNSYLIYFNRILTSSPSFEAATCVELLSFCDSFIKFADIVKKDKIGISDKFTGELYTRFINNVDSVMKTVYACLYLCLQCKTMKYNDKLILTKDIINGDEYNRFVEEGHQIEEIYKYLKAFHRVLEVPSLGIPTTVVLAAETDKRLQYENAAIDIESKIIKSRCLNLAYSSATFEYAKPLLKTVYEDENSKYEALHERVKRNIRTAQTYLHGKLENIEDNLFFFIINSFYNDSLVSVLYESLGKEYAEIAKKSTTIEESDIISANVKTASDIILSYLVGKLCV